MTSQVTSFKSRLIESVSGLATSAADYTRKAATSAYSAVAHPIGESIIQETEFPYDNFIMPGTPEENQEEGKEILKKEIYLDYLSIECLSILRNFLRNVKTDLELDQSGQKSFVESYYEPKIEMYNKQITFLKKLLI